MMNPPFQIKHVKWQDAANELQKIRIEVFIKEQKVPEELEWDNADLTCQHLLVMIDNQGVATARILSSGQIGRMAVLKDYRQQGIGSAMLTSLLEVASTMNLQSVFLNAQVEAILFYKKFGFVEQGDLFNDAGIMHKRMTKTL